MAHKQVLFRSEAREKDGVSQDSSRTRPVPEWALMILFPFGVIIGLTISWWKELLGGLITVGCVVTFYGMHFLSSGRVPQGWAFVTFASPSILFLGHWLLLRNAKQR